MNDVKKQFAQNGPECPNCLRPIGQKGDAQGAFLSVCWLPDFRSAGCVRPAEFNLSTAEIRDLRGGFAAGWSEVERLRGITPELPPYPPDGVGLPRYGIRWNGPREPLAVPMGDGYWTPGHLAERIEADNARLTRERDEAQSSLAEALDIVTDATFDIREIAGSGWSREGCIARAKEALPKLEALAATVVGESARSRVHNAEAIAGNLAREGAAIRKERDDAIARATKAEADLQGERERGDRAQAELDAALRVCADLTDYCISEGLTLPPVLLKLLGKAPTNG